VLTTLAAPVSRKSADAGTLEAEAVQTSRPLSDPEARKSSPSVGQKPLGPEEAAPGTAQHATRLDEDRLLSDAFGDLLLLLERQRRDALEQVVYVPCSVLPEEARYPQRVLQEHAVLGGETADVEHLAGTNPPTWPPPRP